MTSPDRPGFKAFILLADHASDVGGALGLLNVGWTVTSVVPGTPSPAHAVVAFIEVPWSHNNRDVVIALGLYGPDGRVVSLSQPDQPEQPLTVEQAIRLTSPPNTPNGTPATGRVIMQFPTGLPLEPGARYTWRLSIDGYADDQWETSFYVMKPPSPPRFGAGGGGPADFGSILG